MTTVSGTAPAEENQNFQETPMEGLGSEVNPLKRNRKNDDHVYSADGSGILNSETASSEPPNKIPELDGKQAGAKVPQNSASTVNGNGAGDNGKGCDILIQTNNTNLKNGVNFPTGKNEANFDLSALTNEFKEVVKSEIRAVNLTLEDMKGALSNSQSQMSTMKDKIQSNEDTVQATAERVADLSHEFHQMREEWSVMKAQASNLAGRNVLNSIKAQIEKQEWYSRRYNIIIDGIQEPEA